MNHHVADIVTARALCYGLDAGLRSDAVVRELVSLAQGDRRLLELALTRVERGLADRSSRVGERAREALERAVVLVAVGPRVVHVLVSFCLGSSIATETICAGPDA